MSRPTMSDMITHAQKSKSKKQIRFVEIWQIVDTEKAEAYGHLSEKEWAKYTAGSTFAQAYGNMGSKALGDAISWATNNHTQQFGMNCVEFIVYDNETNEVVRHWVRA